MVAAIVALAPRASLTLWASASIFGSGVGVDVLEHEVHAGQRRRAEEVGHQLGAPLVAPAADDRHLGAHAAASVLLTWCQSRTRPLARMARAEKGQCDQVARPLGPGALRVQLMPATMTTSSPVITLHRQMGGSLRPTPYAVHAATPTSNMHQVRPGEVIGRRRGARS